MDPTLQPERGQRSADRAGSTNGKASTNGHAAANGRAKVERVINLDASSTERPDHLVTHDVGATVYHAAKRVVDTLVALIGLAIMLVLLPFIALAIRLDSSGPILFKQQRLGGRRVRTPDGWVWKLVPYTMYKFRSMEVDADPAFHRRYMTAYLTGDEDGLRALRPDRGDGETYRPTNDPRITRIGGWLRRSSLDELPQLFNVLRGDMSVVGPRPPVPWEVDLYEDGDHGRLAARPGLTGWAQVQGRCSIEFDEMLAYDLEYIERRSLWFDLWIMIRTIPVVLSLKGAG